MERVLQSVQQSAQQSAKPSARYLVFFQEAWPAIPHNRSSVPGQRYSEHLAEHPSGVLYAP
jgi:hypothetical protein